MSYSLELTENGASKIAAAIIGGPKVNFKEMIFSSSLPVYASELGPGSPSPVFVANYSAGSFIPGFRGWAIQITGPEDIGQYDNWISGFHNGVYLEAGGEDSLGLEGYFPATYSAEYAALLVPSDQPNIADGEIVSTGIISGATVHIDPTIVNEVARETITGVATEENVVTLQALLDGASGGFYIRSVYVSDLDSFIIAAARFPETYKPAGFEGGASVLTVNAKINLASVEEGVTVISEDAEGSVRYDIPMTLDAGEQSQARENIGSASQEDVDSKVSTIRASAPSGEFDILSATAYQRDLLRPFGPEDADGPRWFAPLECGNMTSVGHDLSLSGGSYTLTNGVLKPGATGNPQLAFRDRTQSPYKTVIARVDAFPNTSSNSILGIGFRRVAASASAGISTGTDAQIAFNINCKNTGATAEIYTAAGHNSVSVALPAKFEMACVWAGVNISGWIRDMTGASPGPWRYVTGWAETSIFDLRSEAQVKRCYPFVIAAASVTGWEISGIRTARPIGAGIANPSVCTYEDGSPVIDSDGYAYFVANAPTFLHASGSGTGIQASQLCIWKYNPKTNDLRRVSIIYCRRGGSIYGENAGCAVFDRSSREWVLLIPNWGSFTDNGTAFTYLYRTKEDILRGEHILDGSQLTLPTATAGYSHWDPALVKIGGTWYLAYSEALSATAPWSFRLRLASSQDLSTWIHVAGYTPASGDVEGAKIAVVGDSVYFTTSTTASASMLVFDPTTLAYLGSVTLTNLDYSGPASHFQIIGFPDQSMTRYFGLSMTKLQWRGIAWSHGDLEVWHINQTRSGWENPITNSNP